MKIALIGYGKMGKTVEQIALNRGHQIVLTIDKGEYNKWNKLAEAEVAIEFTTPDTAVENISRCTEAGVPIVVGTTAWYEQLPAVVEKVKGQNGALLYASNFSLGVNLFFAINRFAAQLISKQSHYTPQISEVHHTQKLDKPSGTALTLANHLLKFYPNLKGWVGDAAEPGKLTIESHRLPDVPGTHTVKFSGAIDEITLTHTAHSRNGFAEGAVLAAEWLPGRKGIFTMSDVLGIE